MNLEFVSETSPILLQECKEFDFDNPPFDPKEFAQALHDKMVKSDGLGLSANQVGQPYRVFVMRTGKEPFAMFNPKVVDMSDKEISMKEGCLSYPNLWLKVTRPCSIVAEYQDCDSNTHTVEMSGLIARCFQHELDHLNGICFVDKVSPMRLQLAMKKLRKRK